MAKNLWKTQLRSTHFELRTGERRGRWGNVNMNRACLEFEVRPRLEFAVWRCRRQREKNLLLKNYGSLQVRCSEETVFTYLMHRPDKRCRVVIVFLSFLPQHKPHNKKSCHYKHSKYPSNYCSCFTLLSRRPCSYGLQFKKSRHQVNLQVCIHNTKKF